MTLPAYVHGVGLLGPGLGGWPEAAAVLSGRAAYVPLPTLLPAPALLPPAERRRTGRVVKLALAVAAQACSHAGVDPAELASVFSSSGGDGHNCHALCEALASPQREVSPTRFSNSVHNAAAGYWSIATGAMRGSNVLCAFDASFGAGLLEAMAQVAVDGEPVLLVAYDTEYPPPLHAKRPLPDAIGVALVLTPGPGPGAIARLDLAPGGAACATMSNSALETLRRSVPTARCLPLLRQLARNEAGTVVLEYLENWPLTIDVEPCA
jgi:hypothetical protein